MEKLDVLESKVDRIQETISEINVTLAVNTASLEAHMQRTALNEESLQVLKRELKPIHDHVLKVNFAMVMLGSIGGVVGFLYLVYNIVQLFRS